MRPKLTDDGSSLSHMPVGRWEFDEAVTAVFADMLSRSIPQYEVMRKAVFDLGKTRVLPGTLIVDIGCSHGDSLAPFIDAFGDRNRYMGVEVSGPMLAVARRRFQDEIDDGLVTIVDRDLRNGFPAADVGLTLCILTLQFIPLEHRQRLLSEAFAKTLPGGVLILVEKILGASANINSQMVSIYHDYKRSAGYTLEQVERKRMALEGVLVPVTARWNEELLRGAGFQEVDCFWRWMNFAGWIATKSQ